MAISAGCAAVALALAVTVSYLIPSQDYALSVEPTISKGQFGSYTHVFIKNTGRHAVTNINAYYGNNKSDFVPVQEPGERIMLSPPDGSDLDKVRITGDDGIDITKNYSRPTGGPLVGIGGF